MKYGDLLEQLRRRLGDIKSPYLWSDEELVEYLSSATSVFLGMVDKNRVVREFQTSSSTIPLSDKLVRVHDVYLPSADRYLKPAEVYYKMSPGTPAYYFVYGLNLELIPPPSSQIAVRVTCSETVDITIDPEVDAPITSIDVPTILFGAMYFAFTKFDVDTYNPRKASEAYTQFRQGVYELGKLWVNKTLPTRASPTGGLL